MQLRDYQQVAVNKLNKYIQSNLGSRSVERRALLQAPTGAGKTVMMSAVINSNTDVAHFVLSPARGGLVKQTQDSLSAYSNGGIVELLTPSTMTRMPYIQAGNTVVLSWESSNKDKNLLIRDNENGNVFDLLRATDAAGIEIVIVIDEAHFATADHTKARQFLDKIAEEIGYTPMTIEVTATPNPKNIPDTDALIEGTCAYVKVSEEEVSKAGMITKNNVINEGVERFQNANPDMNADDVVFTRAFNMIKEFEKEVSWLPAMLVQIPLKNKGGDKYLEYTLHWASKKGWTTDNGKVAIYLDNTKTNTSDLKESDVQLIIFKQGIVMGWDLPRATVLVSFRESANKALNTQVLGRIRRMPEHRHYTKEFLNKSYVYTTLPKNQWVGLDKDFDPGYNLDSELTYRGPSITLPASTNTRVYDVQPDKRTVIKAMQDNKHMQKIAETLTDRLNDPSLSYHIISDAEYGEDGLVNNTADALVKASKSTIQEQFKIDLDKLTGDLDMATFRAAYVAWAHKNAQGYTGNDLALDACTVFLSDDDVRHAFSNFINDLIVHLSASYIVEGYDWSPLAYMPVSSEKVTYGGGVSYAYVDSDGVPTYLESLYKPEHMFAANVDSFGFDSWFKNGVGPDHFRVALPEADHYPDFIAVKDGSSMIIEIKDEDGAMSVASRTKAQVWADYTEEHGIVACVAYYDRKSSMWMATTSDDPAGDIPLAQLTRATELV